MTPESLRRVHELRDLILRHLDTIRITPAEAVAGLTNALGMVIAKRYPEGHDDEVIDSIRNHLPHYVAGYRERLAHPNPDPEKET